MKAMAKNNLQELASLPPMPLASLQELDEWSQPTPYAFMSNDEITAKAMQVITQKMSKDMSKDPMMKGLMGK